MIVKPVCVACRRFLRPEKNGYSFVEGMPKGTYSPKYDADGDMTFAETVPQMFGSLTNFGEVIFGNVQTAPLN